MHWTHTETHRNTHTHKRSKKMSTFRAIFLKFKFRELFFFEIASKFKSRPTNRRWKAAEWQRTCTQVDTSPTTERTAADGGHPKTAPRAIIAHRRRTRPLASLTKLVAALFSFCGHYSNHSLVLKLIQFTLKDWDTQHFQNWFIR